MLRSVDDWEGEQFAFEGAPAPQQPSSVAIDNGADGPTATIPDAHLLFTAQFARAGDNLLLHGEDGRSIVVQDYFASDDRARLLSPEGAALSPDVVAALAGPQAPGQYAQAAATPPAAQAVGRVVQSGGDATIVRNGVAIAANTGDAILKGDVLQTASGSLGVTFNDGSTLNLTANTRLVVNEFVYDPRGSANSQLLDLVQGSLTFISGEIAHTGNMSIGTPVATMGIRGTVGGVTTASDGTVNFYVSQSATGAVILDSRGTIIANVVQDGPLIIVRPVGPLQVLAEEVQKSPAQLAIELAALQQIVSIQSVGQQIIQQYFQTDPNNNPNPNPQSTDRPLTQIQLSIQPNQSSSSGDSSNDDGDATSPATATVVVTTITPEGTEVPTNDDPIIIDIPVDQPPLISGPLELATSEDAALVFSVANENSISLFDSDTAILTVTLTASHGVLTLNGVAGLSFSAGAGTADTTMTFSGSQAAINAALDGMTFAPEDDYNGEASISITSTDGTSTTETNTIPIAVGAVNDAPVIAQPNSPMMSYTEGQPATSIDAVLTLSDIDSATIAGATVKITDNFQAGADVLSFISRPDITGSYNPGTGELTFSGNASIADYQAVLRSVSFSNTSNHPAEAPRTVTYQVNDGSSTNNLSNIVAATINVAAVNLAPMLFLSHSETIADSFDSADYNLSTGSVSWAGPWTEANDGNSNSTNGSPSDGDIYIAADALGSSALKLTDWDNELGIADTIERAFNLAGASSATLEFDYRRDIDPGDIFDNGNRGDLFFVNITVNGNTTQIGQIGATGNGSFVDSDYLHFSANLFNDTSSSTVTVSFSVGDDVDYDDVVYIDNIKITTVSPSSNYAITYFENGAPLPISAMGNVLTDSDDTQMQSAKVKLDNFRPGDLLSVIGNLPVGISASTYNSLTGVLTLTGAATLADYAAALHQVQFHNTDDNPGDADRTLHVTVFDGADNSNTVDVTVHVTPVNDAPEAQDDYLIFAAGNISNIEGQRFIEFPFDFLAVNDDPDGGDIFTSAFADEGGAFGDPAIGDSVQLTNLGVAYHLDGNQDETFSDLFTYRISADGSGNPTSEATVYLSSVDGPELTGGTTNDILVGSAQNETLTGGEGVDGFVFMPGSGNDTVTDFTPGVDKIVLAYFDGVLTNQLSPEEEAFLANPTEGNLDAWKDLWIDGDDTVTFALTMNGQQPVDILTIATTTPLGQQTLLDSLHVNDFIVYNMPS